MSKVEDFWKNQKQFQTDLKPTSANEDVMVYDDSVIMEEFDNGPALGEYCGIKRMAEVFAWKKTFQNVWTGYPNDGKSIFTLFMMVSKSLTTGWKWVLWSPEMRGANYIGNKVVVNYNDMINEIIWMVSGKTVYKHVADKYGTERISKPHYLKLLKWVKKHFIFIDPKIRTIDHIYKLLDSIWQSECFDGVLIDPFKNVKQDIKKRDDLFLEDVFAESKDLAIKNNISFNWVAHPKGNINRIKKVQNEEVLVPCDQWMLNGGAAWNNSMDGIYSIFRHKALTDIRDPGVNFINLKQRKQELVAQRGTLRDIEFDVKTRRYIFSGSDELARIIKPVPMEKLPF